MLIAKARNDTWKNLDSKVYILDTTDMVVETYTIRDIDEMAEKLTIFGYLGGSFYDLSFDSAMNGFFKVTRYGIGVNGAFTLTWGLQKRYSETALKDFILTDVKRDQYIILRPKSNHRWGKFTANFVWGEKIAIGYLLYVEVWLNPNNGVQDIMRLRLFVDKNNKIYIESAWVDDSMSIEMNTNIPRTLHTKLRLLENLFF